MEDNLFSNFSSRSTSSVCQVQSIVISKVAEAEHLCSDLDMDVLVLFSFWATPSLNFRGKPV